MEEERQVNLQERFVDWGIKYVLFDMDSTLVETRNHYLSRMYEYCEYLANRSGIGSKQELFDVFMNGIAALRGEFQVRPAVLDVPARILAKMCGVEGPDLEKQVRKLMMIYELSPDVFPGAADQIKMVLGAGVDTALVTHADEEWTFKKRLKFWGLFGGCVCTPTDKPKDLRAWEDALMKLDIEPGEVMVVGDSWISDIEPVLELGVRKAVWISEDSSKDLPDRVIRIELIADLVEGLLKSF